MQIFVRITLFCILLVVSSRAALAENSFYNPSNVHDGWRVSLTLFLSFAGIAAVFLYYFKTWLDVGRDPEPDIIVPRWEPPVDISPAQANYIDNRDMRLALSATAIYLAVRGFVTLDKKPGAFGIHRTDKPIEQETMAICEKTILRYLENQQGFLKVGQSNAENIENLELEFSNTLNKAYHKIYYKYNMIYIMKGILLSALFVFSIMKIGIINYNYAFTLVVYIIAGYFMRIFYSYIPGSINRGKKSFRKISTHAFITAFFFAPAVAITASIINFTLKTFSISEIMMVYSVVVITLINIIFFELLGKPTALAVKRRAEIAGLKLYLNMAEKDRMNLMGAPQASPQHFETLLPYAVALGVEKPWADVFEDHLDVIQTKKQRYDSKEHRELWAHHFEKSEHDLSEVDAVLAAFRVRS